MVIVICFEFYRVDDKENFKKCDLEIVVQAGTSCIFNILTATFLKKALHSVIHTLYANV